MKKITFKFLYLALLSLVLIGGEAFAQSNETSILGESISNDFKGITSSLDPMDSSISQSTTNRPAVPSTPKPSDKLMHEHYRLEKGAKCIAVPSNIIEFTITEIDHTEQRPCSEFNVSDVLSGPYTFGPLCSCVVGSPEALCEAQNNDFYNRLKDAFKKKVTITHEGVNYTVLVDLLGCYNCNPPLAGPYCKIHDRTSQPGECGGKSSTGTSNKKSY